MAITPIEAIDVVESLEFGAGVAGAGAQEANQSLLLANMKRKDAARKAVEEFNDLARQAADTKDPKKKQGVLESMQSIQDEFGNDPVFQTGITPLASAESTKNTLKQLEFANKLSQATNDAETFAILTDYLKGLGADANNDGTIQLTELVDFAATDAGKETISLTNNQGEVLNALDLVDLDAGTLNGVLQNATIEIRGPGFKIGYLEDGDGEMSINNDKILYQTFDLVNQVSNNAADDLVEQMSNRSDLQPMFDLIMAEAKGSAMEEDVAKNFSGALISNLLGLEGNESLKRKFDNNDEDTLKNQERLRNRDLFAEIS